MSPATAKRTRTRRKTLSRRWFRYGAALLAAAGVAGLAAWSAAMRVQVEGDSMVPTLEDGDRVLVSRAIYWLRPPAPGDVVLARVPAVPGGWTIKRVAAGPGAGASVAADGCARPLPTGRYVLLGDNRAVSVDSRRFGPVPREQIVGRVWYRYWPPERRGRLSHQP